MPAGPLAGQFPGRAGPTGVASVALPAPAVMIAANAQPPSADAQAQTQAHDPAAAPPAPGPTPIDPAKFVHLLALSFAAFFLELMVIRWVPCVIRLVAYYANLLLISSFLGLGIGAMVSGAGGCSAGSRWPSRRTWPRCCFAGGW